MVAMMSTEHTKFFQKEFGETLIYFNRRAATFDKDFFVPIADEIYYNTEGRFVLDVALGNQGVLRLYENKTVKTRIDSIGFDSIIHKIQALVEENSM